MQDDVHRNHAAGATRGIVDPLEARAQCRLNGRAQVMEITAVPILANDIAVH